MAKATRNARNRPSTRIFVTGDKKLDRQLKRLDSKVRNRIARKAMRKAAKPVLDAAKAAVPVDTGELKKNLVIRSLKRSRGNKNKFGVRVVAKESSKRDYIAHFIEFGTVNQAARPFLRPALEINKGQVDAILRAEIAAALKEGLK